MDVGVRLGAYLVSLIPWASVDVLFLLFSSNGTGSVGAVIIL